MRNRCLRRWLTSCHQSRQVKIDSFYNDPEEALTRRKYYKKRNALNCGRPRCCFCMNKRHNPWHNKKQQLTIAERRSEDSFQDQMIDIEVDVDIDEYKLIWKVA
jgi:hypothetical protein